VIRAVAVALDEFFIALDKNVSVALDESVPVALDLSLAPEFLSTKACFIAHRRS